METADSPTPKGRKYNFLRRSSGERVEDERAIIDAIFNPLKKARRTSPRDSVHKERGGADGPSKSSTNSSRSKSSDSSDRNRIVRSKSTEKNPQVRPRPDPRIYRAKSTEKDPKAKIHPDPRLNVYRRVGLTHENVGQRDRDLPSNNDLEYEPEEPRPKSANGDRKAIPNRNKVAKGKTDLPRENSSGSESDEELKTIRTKNKIDERQNRKQAEEQKEKGQLPQVEILKDHQGDMGNNDVLDSSVIKKKINREHQEKENAENDRKTEHWRERLKGNRISPIPYKIRKPEHSPQQITGEQEQRKGRPVVKDLDESTSNVEDRRVNDNEQGPAIDKKGSPRKDSTNEDYYAKRKSSEQPVNYKRNENSPSPRRVPEQSPNFDEEIKQRNMKNQTRKLQQTADSEEDVGDVENVNDIRDDDDETESIPLDNRSPYKTRKPETKVPKNVKQTGKVQTTRKSSPPRRGPDSDGNASNSDTSIYSNNRVDMKTHKVNHATHKEHHATHNTDHTTHNADHTTHEENQTTHKENHRTLNEDPNKNKGRVYFAPLDKEARQNIPHKSPLYKIKEKIKQKTRHEPVEDDSSYFDDLSRIEYDKPSENSTEQIIRDRNMHPMTGSDLRRRREPQGLQNSDESDNLNSYQENENRDTSQQRQKVSNQILSRKIISRDSNRDEPGFDRSEDVQDNENDVENENIKSRNHEFTNDYNSYDEKLPSAPPRFRNSVSDETEHSDRRSGPSRNQEHNQHDYINSNKAGREIKEEPERYKEHIAVLANKREYHPQQEDQQSKIQYDLEIRQRQNAEGTSPVYQSNDGQQYLYSENYPRENETESHSPHKSERNKRSMPQQQLSFKVNEGDERASHILPPDPNHRSILRGYSNQEAPFHLSSESFIPEGYPLSHSLENSKPSTINRTEDNVRLQPNTLQNDKRNRDSILRNESNFQRYHEPYSPRSPQETNLGEIKIEPNSPYDTEGNTISNNFHQSQGESLRPINLNQRSNGRQTPENHFPYPASIQNTTSVVKSLDGNEKNSRNGEPANQKHKPYALTASVETTRPQHYIEERQEDPYFMDIHQQNETLRVPPSIESNRQPNRVIVPDTYTENESQKYRIIKPTDYFMNKPPESKNLKPELDSNINSQQFENMRPESYPSPSTNVQHKTLPYSDHRAQTNEVREPEFYSNNNPHKPEHYSNSKQQQHRSAEPQPYPNYNHQHYVDMRPEPYLTNNTQRRNNSSESYPLESPQFTQSTYSGNNPPANENIRKESYDSNNKEPHSRSTTPEPYYNRNQKQFGSSKPPESYIEVNSQQYREIPYSDQYPLQNENVKSESYSKPMQSRTRTPEGSQKTNSPPNRVKTPEPRREPNSQYNSQQNEHKMPGKHLKDISYQDGSIKHNPYPDLGAMLNETKTREPYSAHKINQNQSTSIEHYTDSQHRNGNLRSEYNDEQHILQQGNSKPYSNKTQQDKIAKPQSSSDKENVSKGKPIPQQNQIVGTDPSSRINSQQEYSRSTAHPEQFPRRNKISDASKKLTPTEHRREHYTYLRSVDDTDVEYSYEETETGNQDARISEKYDTHYTTAIDATGTYFEKHTPQAQLGENGRPKSPVSIRERYLYYHKSYDIEEYNIPLISIDIKSHSGKILHGNRSMNDLNQHQRSSPENSNYSAPLKNNRSAGNLNYGKNDRVEGHSDKGNIQSSSTNGIQINVTTTPENRVPRSNNQATSNFNGKHNNQEKIMHQPNTNTTPNYNEENTVAEKSTDDRKLENKDNSSNMMKNEKGSTDKTENQNYNSRQNWYPTQKVKEDEKEMSKVFKNQVYQSPVAQNFNEDGSDSEGLSYSPKPAKQIVETNASGYKPTCNLIQNNSPIDMGSSEKNIIRDESIKPNRKKPTGPNSYNKDSQILPEREDNFRDLKHLPKSKTQEKIGILSKESIRSSQNEGNANPFSITMSNNQVTIGTGASPSLSEQKTNKGFPRIIITFEDSKPKVQIEGFANEANSTDNNSRSSQMYSPNQAVQFDPPNNYHHAGNLYPPYCYPDREIASSRYNQVYSRPYAYDDRSHVHSVDCEFENYVRHLPEDRVSLERNQYYDKDSKISEHHRVNSRPSRNSIGTQRTESDDTCSCSCDDDDCTDTCRCENGGYYLSGGGSASQLQSLPGSRRNNQSNTRDGVESKSKSTSESSVSASINYCNSCGHSQPPNFYSEEKRF